MEFSDKLSLIAGGNSGIGFEIAKTLYIQGSNVVIIGRDKKKNKEAVTQIKSSRNSGDNLIESFSCDFSAEDQVRSLLPKIKDAYGLINNFINCVGFWEARLISEMTTDHINKIHDNNFLSVALGCTLIPKYMDEGSIINLSSFAALMPMKNCSLYSAYKSAVITFTKSAADELSERNIRVNSVTPGVIETPMTSDHIKSNIDSITNSIALKRIGKPKDIVGPILFLCSDSASYITGENLVISGGKYIVQQ